jgi:hypothetical protein
VGLLLASAAPDAPAAERYRDALCAIAAAAAAAAADDENENENKVTRRKPASPLLVQAFKVASANAAASGDALLGSYLMFAAGDAAEAAATLVAAGGSGNFGGGGDGGGSGSNSRAAGAGWRLAVTLACSALSKSEEEEDRARLRGFLARWAAASLERERGERWRARGVLAAVGAWRPLLASLASPPPPSSFSSFPAAPSSANASPIASSSPDAAASLRRALRARGIATGEEGEEREKAEENAAACSRQWGECLAAAAAL